MIHAMIDLETLGLGSDCVVLSIGCVRFDEEKIDEVEFYLLMDLEEQLRLRKVDAGTLTWWMQQSDDARNAIFKPKYSDVTASIQVAHDLLSQFTKGTERIWAQGTDFDIAVLNSMFRMVGLMCPWKYNIVRDSRTLLDIVPVPKIEMVGTAHNALDDARVQAQRVMKALKMINANREELPKASS